MGLYAGVQPLIKEITVYLSEREIAALQACVEVGQEGPPEVAHDAERAMRKIRNPKAASRAENFYNHSVMNGLIPMECTDDFIKGLMFHWYISGNDDDVSTTMDVVEETFPFFKEML